MHSSKGFWAQALGVGDFYYELGVQIIEICLATRDRNGGLMSFDELRKRVLATSGKTRQDVSEATSYTSLEILMKDLGWTEQRARATLDHLVAEGMAWVDQQDNSGTVLYWFPGLFSDGS
eukprot:Em0404g6a